MVSINSCTFVVFRVQKFRRCDLSGDIWDVKVIHSLHVLILMGQCCVVTNLWTVVVNDMRRIERRCHLSAPFLVKCFSVVSSSISILSSVSIFITFAGMNLFGFLRHSSQHSFRKIIPCEISRFRKWTLFPFKLSFWKSKNSTPFSCSFQVFPSNKKSAIRSRWDWH